MMAIMNLWDISAEEFAHAFRQKDVYLNVAHDIEKKKWDGVLLVG